MIERLKNEGLSRAGQTIAIRVQACRSRGQLAQHRKCRIIIEHAKEVKRSGL
jgi:hypothetical protein